MDIFVEFGIIIIFTAIISIIISYFKQPLIIGYIISGVLLGPLFFNLLNSSSELEIFSKIGISILLFIVGINLNVNSVKETGKASVLTGIGQIIFTSVFGYIILIALGFDKLTAIYSAIALTFSSTIIILKLLSDRGDVDKLYGRISVGFLLIQDLAATLFLILVPILATYSISGESDIFFTLSSLFVKGGLAVFIIYVFTRFVFPKLLNYLAKNQELLFIFSISWGLFLSVIFYKLGYSIEIGALIAGVFLSTSKYAGEISSRLRVLRDFFIVLFFILLGAHLQFGNFSEMIFPISVLSLFVLIGNPIIVFILLNLLKYKRRVAFMAGLTVAQISEFSLILMALGLSLNHVSTQAVSLITFVGIITIMGSTYMILYADKLYNFFQPLLKFLEIRKQNISSSNEEVEVCHSNIIFGFGRVGIEFAKTLSKAKEDFLIIEHNPNVLVDLEKNKINFNFGDAEDVEFLNSINFFKAKRIISTIPDFRINQLLVKYYRERNKNGVILVIAHNVKQADELYEAGASFVLMTYLLGAHHAADMMLDHSFRPEIFEEEKKKQYLRFKYSGFN